jgi:hypothetical protein
VFLNLSVIHSNVEFAAGPAAVLIVRRLATVFEFALAAYVVWKMSRPAALSR